MSKKDYIVRCSVAQLRGLEGVGERANEIEQETKHKLKKADLINIVENNYMFYIGKSNVPRGLTIEMYKDAYEQYENKQDEEEVELPELEEVADVKRSSDIAKKSSDIAKKDTDKLFDKLENLLSQLIEYIRAEVNDKE